MEKYEGNVMLKMKLRLVAFAGMLATMYLMPVVSAELDFAQLRSLLEAGQATQAYQLALPHLAEQEGNADFDFLYGQAAIDAGKVNEGIYALERVLFANPQHLRARLELARGYFLVGEDRSARREFERVLATNPPAAVKDKINYFLAAIRLRETEYRTTASAYVEYGVGHDSNVNSAPVDANFYSPLLGAGTLSNIGVELHDAYGQVAMGGQFNKPIKPGASLFAGFDGFSRNNTSLDTFEADAINFQGGLKVRSEKDQYKFSLQEQRYFLGNTRNQNLHGVGVEWSRPLNTKTQMIVSAQRADLLYPNTPIQDATAYSAGATLLQGLSLPYAPILFGSMLVGKDHSFYSDDTAKSVAQRTYGGLRAGAVASFNSKTSVTTSLYLQNGTYGAENILFFKTREDQFYSFDLSLTHLLKEQWKLKAMLTYSENHSNIEIYDYDRMAGELAIRYELQ